MTKKDYITIANALKPFYNSYSNDYKTPLSINDVTIEIVTALSKAMSKDNPKFNPVRFLDMIRGTQQ